MELTSSSRKQERRDAVRRWRLKNKDRVAALDKKYRESNKEKYLAREAAYREKNREKLREKRREYRRRHPDRIDAALKKHRESNIVALNERAKLAMRKRSLTKLTDPSARIEYLATMALHRSRRRGREYEVGFADELIANPPADCACCRVVLNYERGKGKNIKTYPSIDRVDNTRGYIKGNVAIICRDCNTAKRNHSYETLQRLLSYMERHWPHRQFVLKLA